MAIRYLLLGLLCWGIGPAELAVSGEVRTVAGTGENRYFGDGGPATAAGVGSPFGVVIGPDGHLNGAYRSQMTTETLQDKNYGRRWLVESFMSGLKRTTGSTLAARSEHCLFVEAAIKVLAYALRR